jgi:hypothetical protein
MKAIFDVSKAVRAPLVSSRVCQKYSANGEHLSSYFWMHRL